MKLDPSKPLTIGARRTLKALVEAMEQMLAKKDFEQIQIKEICDMSMIPRATFYNYFEDKYDLLDYVFHVEITPLLQGAAGGAAGTASGTGAEEGSSSYDPLCDHMQVIDVLLGSAEEHREELAAILRKNPVGGAFVRIYEAFFRKEVYQYIYACGIYEGYDIPRELMAQVTADVILDVYEWVYIKGNETPREEIDRYISKMLIR